MGCNCLSSEKGPEGGIEQKKAGGNNYSLVLKKQSKEESEIKKLIQNTQVLIVVKKEDKHCKDCIKIFDDLKLKNTVLQIDCLSNGKEI